MDFSHWVNILRLQNDIKNMHPDRNYRARVKYITHIYGKRKPITNCIKRILEFEYGPHRAILDENIDTFMWYHQLIQTAEKEPMGATNAMSEEEVHKCIARNTIIPHKRGFNKHIGVDDDWCIYYKLDVLIPKTCPNSNCRALRIGDGDFQIARNIDVA